jgi:hypothetical protein
MNDSNNDYVTFPDHTGIQKRIITQGTGENPPNNYEVEGRSTLTISSLHWETR